MSHAVCVGGGDAIRELRRNEGMGKARVRAGSARAGSRKRAEGVLAGSLSPARAPLSANMWGGNAVDVENSMMVNSPIASLKRRKDDADEQGPHRSRALLA